MKKKDKKKNPSNQNKKTFQQKGDIEVDVKDQFDTALLVGLNTNVGVLIDGKHRYFKRILRLSDPSHSQQILINRLSRIGSKKNIDPVLFSGLMTVFSADKKPGDTSKFEKQIKKLIDSLEDFE